MKSGSPSAPVATTAEVSYEAAALLAISEEMRDQSNVVFISTERPAPLLEEFGPERVLMTPISEASATGVAIGAAACGLRPIVWWRNAGFSMVAFDQVINHAAKLRYMSGGQTSVPLVMRAYCGAGLRLAAQHSQAPYALFTHVPGLKVIAPSTAEDIRGLLLSAIRENNPVVSMEAYQCRGLSGQISTGDSDHAIPLGSGRVHRQGNDVTLVAISHMVHVALEAAEELSRKGIAVEIIDPRSLVPLDIQLIKESACRTGRIVIVDEAPPRCSVAHDIAGILSQDQDVFASLVAPMMCVTSANVPTPYSPSLEDAVLPTPRRVAQAIERVLDALPKTPSQRR